MKIYTKLVMVALAIGLIAVSAFAQGGGGAGKVSLRDFSVVAGTPAARNNAHRETIEIMSWSLGASNPTSAAGQTQVNSGILNFAASSVSPAVGQLCQSHAKIGSMTIESNGQRREFRDVIFKDCPAGGTGGTFTLTFNGQTTAGLNATAAGVREVQTVTITGLTPVACQNNLKQLGIATHSATLYVGTANGGVWKTTNGGTPARGTQFPSVVIEGRGGTKVTFLKVTLEDAMITSYQSGGVPSEAQKIVLTFESTTATPQLVDALLSGR